MISIRRNLVTVLIASLTLLIFLAALNGYRKSLNNTNELFDSELVAIASVISLAAASSNPVDLEENTSISFQIWKNNQLILRSSNSPKYPFTGFKEGFADKNFSADRWRTYSHYQLKQQQWILVAQKSSRRIELAEKVILASVYPIVLSIPMAAILIWLIISHGLKPLKTINNQLILRKADNLNPIQTDAIPGELQTVTDTINHLLNRLQLSFDREKRFAGDAAHELRTPLSVLKINMHNLEQEIGHKHTGLKELKLGANRMTHVIDQILTLYRATPEQFSGEFEKIDLYQICQQTISEYYPEISKKHQTIELEGKPILILGEHFYISSLLLNLISNASKYTPEYGQIIVSVTEHEESIELSVEDSGEGIPEEFYHQVFQRFYRIGGDQHKSGAPGCGLGLSIVQHIVELHRATIELSHSKFKTGLKMTVIFLKSRLDGTSDE